MKTLYTKFFLVALFLAATLTLSACGGGHYTPWDLPEGSGIVTKDPNSIPDIGWQTTHQRQVLTKQSHALEAQEKTPAAPEAAATETETETRASLQTVFGTAPVKEKTRVALLLPLSGKHADLGQAMLKAAQMALFDVGSANFELMPEDTASSSDGAAKAARNAVAKDKADLILGPVFAEDLKAVKTALAGTKTPVIAFTTDWTLAEPAANTYIMGFLPFAQVARVAQYTQRQGFGSFGVYAPQTEYCDVVISTLQRTGVRISRTDRYSPLETDLGPLVKDFADRSKNGEEVTYDALLLPVGGEGLRTALSLLDLNGISNKNVKLVGTGLWDDPALTGNPNLYGGWFAAPDPRSRADFEKRFEENFGTAAPRLASLAYDATALAAVLSRTTAPGDMPYARERLTHARGFAGVDGIFRFRPDGLIERGLAVLEIQAGRFKVIDPAPTAFISSGS